MGKDIDRNITRQLWERVKNVFMRIVSPKFNGYSIKGIKIGPYSTFMSINNNTFSLSGYFNDKNTYNYTFSKFIPFV